MSRVSSCWETRSVQLTASCPLKSVKYLTGSYFRQDNHDGSRQAFRPTMKNKATMIVRFITSSIPCGE